MAAILIWIAIGAFVVIGAYTKFHAQWTAEGRAACQAELRAADDRLKAAADALTLEATNHIADMATAYEVGESEAKTRTVYVQSKGAGDVKRFDVFTNPICVLPNESLRNLNAARAGLRHDPPTDRVRASGDGSSASVRPPADSRAPDGAVRGAGADPQGDARRDVSDDVGGRRPLGKVR